MLSWAIRRLLLMIPMLFGISLINFAIINFSDPTRTSAANADGRVDPSQSVEAGEAERIFRQTFNLDKPAFFNTRYNIEDDEILWRLMTAQRVYALPSARTGNLKVLEDYGRTIVPHLVRLAKKGRDRKCDYDSYNERWKAERSVWLKHDRPIGDIEWPPPADAPAFDEAFQEIVLELALHRLYANAPRRAHVKYGGGLSKEDAAYNREVRAEQRNLKTLFLEGLKDEEGRRSALAGWSAWSEGHADEWEYSFWRKTEMLFFETRFARYWKRLVSFDLGDSFLYRTPVSTLIWERLHISLILSFGSLILAYLIAVPLGILSARTHGSASDRVVSIALFAMYALPTMFLGILLRDWFATQLGWFPVSKFKGSGYDDMTVVEQFKDVAWHTTLPLITMTVGSLAYLSRYMKSGLIENLRADYVRTARAKGLSEFVVTMRHAVRNSLIPIITLLGASLPAIIGGSVIVEVVFDIDGMGKLGWQAVLRQDYAVILGINILAAILTMVGVFLTDLFYALLDPRISYK